ncbi:MAG: endonuclease MutS2, partial [Oscillospiraceae bacterium]
MNKNYISLELHKILQMLSDLAVSEECKKNCLRIKPSNDYDEVCQEVQKTDEAFVLSARFGTPNFKALLNPQPALERADAGAMLSLKKLLDIKDILSETRDVQKWYEETESSAAALDNLFSCLMPDKAFEERLASSILSETELADDASPELLSIRRKIIIKEGLVRERLSKIVKSSETQKYLQDNIITMRDGRYVVPVKSEYKDNISGLVHDTSASGATFFVEPMSVVEINNDIRVLQSREQAEIERIIRELSALCAERKMLIESNYSALMSLELLFSKSNLACRLEASKPAITNDGYINLIKARHPLISKDSIVPIDITLGNENNAL